MTRTSFKNDTTKLIMILIIHEDILYQINEISKNLNIDWNPEMYIWG